MCRVVQMSCSSLPTTTTTTIPIRTKSNTKNYHFYQHHTGVPNKLPLLDTLCCQQLSVPKLCSLTGVIRCDEATASVEGNVKQIWVPPHLLLIWSCVCLNGPFPLSNCSLVRDIEMCEYHMLNSHSRFICYTSEWIFFPVFPLKFNQERVKNRWKQVNLEYIKFIANRRQKWKLDPFRKEITNRSSLGTRRLPVWWRLPPEHGHWWWEMEIDGLII